MVEGHIRPPVVVDVREDLRSGRQPLSRILQAVKSVVAGQDLVLLTTFEPIPLYRVLSLRGFTHEAHPLPGGDWEVRFLRRRRGQIGDAARRAAPPSLAPGQPAPTTAAAPTEDGAPWVRLDNRGLEPPQPMMRTFEALSSLLQGQVLEIHNDRRPMFLYPHLEERGYRYQTVDEADGSACVRIWKP